MRGRRRRRVRVRKKVEDGFYMMGDKNCFIITDEEGVKGRETCTIQIIRY